MPCSPTTPCSFVLRQEEETADTENPMLVPGMYTTFMLYGESRPTTFPSQNQHIHEPSYNPDNAWVLRPLWAHNKYQVFLLWCTLTITKGRDLALAMGNAPGVFWWNPLCLTVYSPRDVVYMWLYSTVCLRITHPAPRQGHTKRGVLDP